MKRNQTEATRVSTGSTNKTQITNLVLFVAGVLLSNVFNNLESDWLRMLTLLVAAAAYVTVIVLSIRDLKRLKKPTARLMSILLAAGSVVALIFIFGVAVIESLSF